MSETHLLPLVAEHAEWKVEVPSDVLEHPAIVAFEEVYTSEFGIHNPHMNFIATENGKGLCIFSVQKNPAGEFPKTSSIVILGPTYKALLTDAEGYEEFYIHNVALQKGGTDPLPVFEEFLNNRLMRKEIKIYGVTQKSFIREMVTLEEKYSRRLKTMKIAVLYIKPGQNKIKEEIFLNHPPENSRFFQFMDQIAERINMKNWKGYRGDMGKDGDDTSRDSYYTKWMSRDVMFHIAPYMNSEQHRRLVGNDIAVIIFFDNPNPTKCNLQLFGGSEIGIVPHVFTVVEPHPSDLNKYRIASFSRPAVPSYKPDTPPSTTYIKVKHLKDFLFTKIHNGLAAAQSVAPMNRLYTVPRREAIKDLVERYPKKSQGTVKSEKGAGTTKLKVTLIQGKDLASKDSNGLSDPYCRVIVGDMEMKSQIKKKTLKPLWNEVFEFDLDDDYQLEEFHIICMDWDKVGSHDYMGEHRVLLKDLPLDKDPTWFSLLGTTTEEVSGQIQLQFKLISQISEEVEEEKRKKGIRGIGRKKIEKSNRPNSAVVNNQGSPNSADSRKNTPIKLDGTVKIQNLTFDASSKADSLNSSLKMDKKPDSEHHTRSMKGSKSSDNIQTTKINSNNSEKDNNSGSPRHGENNESLSPRRRPNQPSPMLSDVHKKKWVSVTLGGQDEVFQPRRSYSIGAVTEKKTKAKKQLIKDSVYHETLGQINTIKQEVESVWGVTASPEPCKDIFVTKVQSIKKLISDLATVDITDKDESLKQSVTEVSDAATNFLRTCIVYTKLKLDHADYSNQQKPLEIALQTFQTSITNCINNLQMLHHNSKT